MTAIYRVEALTPPRTYVTKHGALRAVALGFQGIVYSPGEGGRFFDVSIMESEGRFWPLLYNVTPSGYATVKASGFLSI